jgi:hypothetical protein
MGPFNIERVWVILGWFATAVMALASAGFLISLVMG